MLKKLRTLSFRRRLNGDASHTVQRIVEEALAKYLGEQKEVAAAGDSQFNSTRHESFERD